ncbi:MAG: MATE family efflux transporter [Oscillospiraceae bacterium]
MGKSANVDLINGEPSKMILRFALPLIFANLFQQLYNTVDTIIVGRFNGDDALAAVGASFAVTMVMIAFATGTGTGCSVLISKRFGERDLSEVKTAVSTVLIFSLIFSVIIGAAGLIFSKSLLEVLETPKNIIKDAESYLMIYSAGMPFMFLYNVQSSIFSSFGNSKTPLALLIMSSLINIALDLLFVGYFSMGVKGAAAATLIAQAFSGTVSFVLLIKNVYFGNYREYSYRHFSFSTLKQMLSYAAVSVVQTSVTSIGMMLIQAVINRFGSGALAGYTAASKIDSFAIMPYLACSNAISTFTAQNIGAGQRDRVSAGFKAGLKICLMMSLIEFALISALHDQFLSLFMDINTVSHDAIETGLAYMITMSFCYWIMGINSCQNGMLRGTGMLNILLANSILGLIIRVVFAYTAVNISFIGVSSVWLSMPVGWTFSIIFCIAARKFVQKRKIKS